MQTLRDVVVVVCAVISTACLLYITMQMREEKNPASNTSTRSAPFITPVPTIPEPGDPFVRKPPPQWR